MPLVQALPYTKNHDLKNLIQLDDLIFTGIARAALNIRLYDAGNIFCWHLDNKSNRKGRIDQRMVGLYNRFHPGQRDSELD